MKKSNETPSIHVLDPVTVNQIAAGEVVERPVSVVKELVENAIDANSRAIRIEITSSEGEIKTIRVIDDGTGMSEADAVLAFTPHATSKIKTIDDLHHTHTLGFRGEALASIAAVSRVTLVTKLRRAGIVLGTKVVVEGGAMKGTEDIGAPEGTNVLVEDLFYNTPARKKFQKSLNNELGHIYAIMEGICLSHPGISIHILHNKKEQLVTDRTSNIVDTIARIYGSDVAKNLIPVSSSLPFMTISGYIAPPSISRKDSTRMLIAINQRYISSPSITAAIKEGYGTLLLKDRSPVAFIALTIDTELIDVNVHPTKKVVRLSREKEISQAIREAVNAALLSYELIPSAKWMANVSRLVPAVFDSGPEQAYRSHETLSSGVTEPTHFGTISTDRQLRQTELATGVRATSGRLPDLNVIGEFGGIYIIAKTNTDELVLIDQHAAHERIFYEMVTSRMHNDHRSQELIIPVILHRSPKDAAVIRDLLPALEHEGFIIEEFGRDTFLVRSIPVVLGRLEETGLIDEIMSDLVHGKQAQAVNTRERIIRIIACRGAIKAGTVCTLEQCQRIVNQLRLTKNPFTCPHGRPTLVRFSRADLDGMFKRT